MRFETGVPFKFLISWPLPKNLGSELKLKCAQLLSLAELRKITITLAKGKT